MIELEKNLPMKRDRDENNPDGCKRRKIDRGLPQIPSLFPAVLDLLKQDNPDTPTNENFEWPPISPALDLPLVNDLNFDDVAKKIIKDGLVAPPKLEIPVIPPTKTEFPAATKPRKATKKAANNKAGKKTSRFKNIFWGKQQSAWMGSIRVKGTIVRSCSRKSDVLAARILNSRCKKKGIPAPNPEVGFLNDTDLAACTQVRRKKKKNCKRKKSKRTRSPSKGEISTSLKNIFWGKQQQAWMGNVRVKGKIVRSCSRISDVMAAKILNTRCRDQGLKAPNPEVGYCDCSVVVNDRYMKSHSFTDVSNTDTSTTATNSSLKNSEHTTTTDLETVNVYDPYTNIKQQFVPEKSCCYKNVFWNDTQQEWIGCVQYKERFIRSSCKDDALTAAKMLNYRCVGVGAPLPNPEVGFPSQSELNNIKYGVSGTRFPPSLHDFPSLPSTTSHHNVFDKEVDTLFSNPNSMGLQSLTEADMCKFFGISDDIPISPAFDLPPCSKDKLLSEFSDLLSPRICHDNYKQLNSSMFNYMSDLLAKDTDDLEDSFLDDLPFSGNWSSGLLSTV